MSKEKTVHKKRNYLSQTHQLGADKNLNSTVDNAVDVNGLQVGMIPAEQNRTQWW